MSRRPVNGGTHLPRSYLHIFPLIDALRGFAALSVLVYHVIVHWQWSDFPAVGPLAWLPAGWMGVDLFFVISGFVIGLSVFGRMDAHDKGFRAAFLRSRLARIVPLHYLTLAVYILVVELALWLREGDPVDLLAHLLFIHNLFPPYAVSVNGANWSLGTEMQFYALVAVAAPWLYKARWWHIAFAFVAIAWGWRWGTHVLLVPESLDRAFFAQTQLPGMLDEFAIGLLLARFVRTSAGASFLARVRSDARVRYGLATLAAFSWWALLGIFHAHDFWREVAMAVFFRTALACCAGLVVLLLCGWPMPRRPPVFVRVPLYLGKTSYGIYLWHVSVLLLLARHTNLGPTTALMVALPATIGLAALTWHFVEAPLLQRFAGPRRAIALPEHAH